jgi:hypothetical protein
LRKYHVSRAEGSSTKRLIPVVAIIALSIDAKTAAELISTVHLASQLLINIIYCTGYRLVMYLFAM